MDSRSEDWVGVQTSSEDSGQPGQQYLAFWWWFSQNWISQRCGESHWALQRHQGCWDEMKNENMKEWGRLERKSR